MEDDAALLGLKLPEPDLEQDADFIVDEDNWETVMLFCQCATQWQYGAMGGVIGLNYPGVKSVMDVMLPRKRHADVFTGLQLMERAALGVLNAKQG